MSLDRITVTLGLTINKGNFNSLRVDATYETDVRDGEDLADAYLRAWTVVDDEISAKAEEDGE